MGNLVLVQLYQVLYLVPGSTDGVHAYAVVQSYQEQYWTGYCLLNLRTYGRYY